MFSNFWHSSSGIDVFSLGYFIKVYRKQLEEHKAKVSASLRKQSNKWKTTEDPSSEASVSDKAVVPKSRKDEIQIPTYNVANLDPIDMAAHLQLLGDSLTMIATALRRQVRDVNLLVFIEQGLWDRVK